MSNFGGLSRVRARGVQGEEEARVVFWPSHRQVAGSFQTFQSTKQQVILALSLSLRRFSLLSPPRLLLLCFLSAFLILCPAYIVLRSTFEPARDHNALWAPGSVGHEEQPVMLLSEMNEHDRKVAELVLHGGVIMPKMANATLKAEIGRNSWKLLHTMAARFPEVPDESEKAAFKSFLYLFARMYPCGECSQEFQSLLRKHPPQTSSRGAASLHLCFLHNQVNSRLGKPEFDCSSNLEGIYDCGCGTEPGDDDPRKHRKDVDISKKAFKQRKKVKMEDLVGGELGLEKVEEEEDGGERDKVTGKKLVGG